ncbi:hypothetical protein BSKO_10360 [Bryopsis sp. KO-2023]|nr:hypothetical protein BSKO_10360 [Bryopsis sp. KO-2023]
MDARYADILAKLGGMITAPQQTHVETPSPLQYMSPHLEAFGLEETLGSLKVIHVAGSKGKGSTCSMVESILRSSGYTTGLFTSPHLCDVRERIRINGALVDEQTFMDACEWGFHRLKAVKEDNPFQCHPMAACFRFLFLLAVKIFGDQGVDVVILEVGLGGRLDATNIIRNPVVCGVSSLGYEHTAILGSTLTEIAGEKAGIFKAGCPAVTVPQDPEAMCGLRAHATKEGVELSVARNLNEYRNADMLDPSLQAGYQAVNMALAISLAKTWEESSCKAGVNNGARHRCAALAKGEIPREYIQALRNFNWPGRAQVVQDAANLKFYLDGAHSKESIRACGKWFPGGISSDSDPCNVLLFNCTEDRDARGLLKTLTETLHARAIHFRHAVFSPSVGTKGGLTHPTLGGTSKPEEAAQRLHLDIWKEESMKVAPPAAGVALTSVGCSIDYIRGLARERTGRDVRVLVTGSLYLVGNVLKFLGRAPK